MIPGAQKFFRRQPSEYEKKLQDDSLTLGLRVDHAESMHDALTTQVEELTLKIKTLENNMDLSHQSLDEKIETLRREMLGYIKPEAPKEEEAAPAGFQTFTQRRSMAAAKGSTQKIREVAAKTEQVLKQEKA